MPSSERQAQQGAEPALAQLARQQQQQSDPRVAAMLQLQRTAGNQAVMLLRKSSKEKAEEAFAAAKATPDWNAAAAALRSLKREDRLTTLAGLTAAELSALDAVVKPSTKSDDKLTHRCISFIQHGPADATGTKTGGTIVDAGKLEDTHKVKGGKIAVHTGVHYTKGANDRPSGFTMSYKGDDSAKTRWLQFVWREIIVHKPKKKAVHLNDTITTTGGTYKLTDNPSKPNYNTDSNTASTPFYEGGFLSERTADSTTIFDYPAPMKANVTPHFEGDEPAGKVVSRAHFTTYLVRGMDVLYKIKTDIEWVFDDADEPERTYSTRGAGSASRLNKRQRERLIEQYPGFDYLP